MRHLAIVVLVALVAACATPGIQTRKRPARFARLNAGFTPTQQAHLTENTGQEWGMPQKTMDFGRTDFVTRKQYVLEHSAFDRIPIWVAHHIERSEIDGPSPGGSRPKWKEEPQLDPSVRADDVLDYKPFVSKPSDPYDRGHMTPNADFDVKADRNSTFFLSNVVPQAKQHNQQIWNQLEAKVREWVLLRGEAYVVTGGMFYEEEEDADLGNAGDGVIEYEVIGEHEVAVPTHLFKIVLAPKSQGSTEWEAIRVRLREPQVRQGERRLPLDDGLAVRRLDRAADRPQLLPQPRRGPGPPRRDRGCGTGGAVAGPMPVRPSESVPLASTRYAASLCGRARITIAIAIA